MVRHFYLILLSTLCVTVMVGCDLLFDPGWKKVAVEAQYDGLANRKVAIVVNAAGQAEATHPDAAERVARAVAARLKSDVPGIAVTDPGQVAFYQQRNPYWRTKAMGELVDAFEVDRILYIGLSTYATHEPTNSHVWRGQVVSNVGVIEAQSPERNNYVFLVPVAVTYPSDRPLGVLQSDDETIELGMLHEFSRAVSRLFHDHQVTAR